MAQQKSQDELWKQKLLATVRAEEEARELVERAYQSADVLSSVLLEPRPPGASEKRFYRKARGEGIVVG
ncbi:MAG: hypothetical protein M3Y17_12910 [Actinomycetota bacterium]|nr:hypothetical protein [Actinomycetota bacterium]